MSISRRGEMKKTKIAIIPMTHPLFLRPVSLILASFGLVSVRGR